jgi:hypothetical protein
VFYLDAVTKRKRKMKEKKQKSRKEHPEISSLVEEYKELSHLLRKQAK